MVQFFFGSLWTKSEPTGSDLHGKEVIPNTDRTKFLLL